MKKYLSVFAVTARESIWRISFLWLISAVLQTVFFYREMFSEKVQGTRLVSEAFSPYEDKITVPVIFALTLLLTGILLMKTGMEFRTKTGYTLRRLRITEKQVYLIQSSYNCLMIFLLFLFETAFCFALVNWGTTFFDPKYITNQTVYLTFYSSEFLQNMFAGRNILKAARNIFIIISLGFNLSAFSYLWRRGSKYIFGVVLLVACSFLFWWSPDYGGYAEDVGFLITAVGMLITALSIVKSRREEYDT